MRDLVERTVATFVQALAAAVAVDGFDVTSAAAWRVAVIAAGLAALKWLAVQTAGRTRGSDDRDVD